MQMPSVKRLARTLKLFLDPRLENEDANAFEAGRDGRKVDTGLAIFEQAERTNDNNKRRCANAMNR